MAGARLPSIVMLRLEPAHSNSVLIGGIHLQTICCHPVADVGNAMTKTRNGRHCVVTLTVNVHLRVVSIAVELHIVPSNHISKVRHIEDEKS